MKIYYTDGYKYQLAEDYYHQLKFVPGITNQSDWITIYEDGRLFIRKGYAWDGASGPTYDTKSSMRGSLVHDALYQMMRLELVPDMWRAEADTEFYDILVEDGMWKWRAGIWYRSVKKWAKKHVKSKMKKKIIIAP